MPIPAHKQIQMKRRKFLQTIGLATPAALLGANARIPGVDPLPLAPNLPAEPKVYFFDDGRHAAGLYQFEPPLTPEDHCYTVDQLVNTGIDTYIYAATLEGGVVQYDSRVAQKWGDNVQKWNHAIWYRAGRNLKQLVADGHDPLKLLIDAAHRGGILFLPSCHVDLQGGDRATHGGWGRKSDFVYEHPQFHVGEEDDPRAKGVSPTRFNLLHAEAREERFRVAEELLTRYETDGLELNLAEDDYFGPYCRFDEVDRLAPLLTEWIRRIRAAARKAEQAQGRRKHIYARIFAHPDTWKMLGYEVSKWVSEGIIDGLICASSDSEHLDQDVDLEPALRVTRGTKCRVLAAYCNVLSRQLRRYGSQMMIWAGAANSYAQGAHGFGLADAHWTPNGWPLTDHDYQTLRILGNPDLLATVDKCYHVRSDRTPGTVQAWLPGGARSLTRTLKDGETAEIPLRIADDLPRWHKLGRVKSVRLRIRFANLVPTGDKIKVEWNGARLPDSILTRIDLNYRLLPNGAINPYGYIHEYRLPLENYPRSGRNNLKITLIERDPMLLTPFEVYDVDCAIEYRLHRNFVKRPIEY